MKTTAAHAAKDIKAKLKAAFPGVKFSVKSDTFTGGSAVRISYEDGPTLDAVKAISDPYQYGSFNAMDDSYSYDNRDEDIPQVKWVNVSRDMSPQTRQAIYEEMRIDFGVEFSDERAGYFLDELGGQSPREYAYRIFVKRAY